MKILIKLLNFARLVSVCIVVAFHVFVMRQLKCIHVASADILHSLKYEIGSQRTKTNKGK